MTIAEILKLNREEIWSIYRELAFARCEYRREKEYASRDHYLFPEASRRGRPRDIALGVFVARLRRIYTACTRQKPTCYWSEEYGAYRGDFLMLCELVAKERLPGKAVARALKSIRLRAATR